MSGPLYSLKHEHRVIERALRALDGICLRVELGECVPQSAVAQIVEFISAFVDRFHHGKEETYLFPALERQGILREGGPLAAIELEHETERALTDVMLDAAAAFGELDNDAKRRFVEAGRRYTGHMVAHIRAEDGLLFRLADEILEEADIARLREGFECAERELGPRTRLEYEDLATQLEAAWLV
ncbi:MAG TPA: hemerythrin domain-containing protein [Blastocatellia bacterium]|nr:hemerythrin domain-containing protein [Blastocatellia bacterium]